MPVGGKEGSMDLLMASLLGSLALQRLPGGREPRSDGVRLLRLCERLRLICICGRSRFDQIETQTRPVGALADFLRDPFHVVVPRSPKQTLSQPAYSSDGSRDERDCHHEPYPKDGLLGRGEMWEGAMQKTQHVLLEPRGKEMMRLAVIPANQQRHQYAQEQDLFPTWCPAA